MAKYQKKCYKCKKNYILVGWRDKFPLCYDCAKEELHQEIKDPKMKKMFDIPEEFYEESLFLRDIKLKYIRFGNLTEKQIEAFIKVVKEMKE